MKTQRKWIFGLLLAFPLFEALPVCAQDAAPPPDQPPAFDQPYQAGQPSPGWRRMGVPQGQMQRDTSPPPSTLTLPAGAWLTVRVNQPLSSDHN